MTMKDDYNNEIKGGPNPVMASAGDGNDCSTCETELPDRLIA